MTDTQITRWAPYVIDGGYRVAYGEMEEDEIGDWVNYEDHTAHIDAQDAKIAALVEALGKLCFEVAGLQAFEQGVRHEIGNTNYAAIMTRLEAGGVALAAAKDKPYE